MKALRSVCLGSLVALGGVSSALAQIGTLDLATTAPGSIRNLRVQPNVYDLVVTHRLPGKTYKLEVTVDLLPIAAFTLSNFRAPDTTDAATVNPLLATVTTSKVDCAAPTQAVLGAASEAELLAILAGAPAGCDLEKLTRESLGSYELAAGQILTVKIERDGQSWTWTFTTGARGEWRTTYGFTFVPNEDREYVTRAGAGADGKQFQIVEQKDREVLDFVPSVLFNWIPAQGASCGGRKSPSCSGWSRGWTAGLGWDLEKPVVFAGYSWLYNENVNFTLGLAIHQQTRLIGKYSAKKGDPANLVGEALEPAQLVATTYGPNVYLGVGFRFDRNDDPFARSAALQKQSAAAEAARLQTAAEAAAAKKAAEELQKACEAKATKEHTDALATCDTNHANDATKLAACRKQADDTETAAKAACPPAVAKKLADEAAARAATEAKERKRLACLAQAGSTFKVAKNTCEKTHADALAAAEKKHTEALAECGKKPETERPACKTAADAALAEDKKAADTEKTSCIDDAEATRDAAKLACEG